MVYRNAKEYNSKQLAMNKILDLKEYFIEATQLAAISCHGLKGKKDKNAADEAAVNSIREVFKRTPFDGIIPIGEGEIDEAPMLYIGEHLGTMIDKSNAVKADIAVDPLECTKNCAFDLPNAITVLAIAPRNTLLNAPDTYMNKVVGGKDLVGYISLNNSIEDNIKICSKVLEKKTSDIVVIVLDRPRNQYIMDAVTSIGAKYELISDGDIMGSLRVICGEADMLMGIGSAPEGVITATAVKGMRGVFEGQLKPHNNSTLERTKKMLGENYDKIWTSDELCTSDDSVFVATGVCDGWLKGVEKSDTYYSTTTCVIDVDKKTMNFVKEKFPISIIQRS